MDTERIARAKHLDLLLIQAGHTDNVKTAATLGIGRSTIVAHRNGTRPILPKMADKYAQLLGISPAAILYGHSLNQLDGIQTIISTRDVALRQVPLLDCTDMEQFRSIASGAKPTGKKQIFAPIELPPGNRIFALVQLDQSMEDHVRQTIQEGENVFINPDLPHQSGTLVAALVPGANTIMVRKYRTTIALGEGGQTSYDLVALHPDFGVIKDAHKLGVQIIGVVIGSFRPLHPSMMPQNA